MKPVLMVAFHYPPCFGSSGIHRTLKFSRYLPDSGWLPIVLTADPRAYRLTTTAQLAEIPPEVTVTRSPALDSHRHLAIRGKSLAFTSIPDQWATWWLSAVPAGLRLIRRHRPAIIWSTYPTPTAHLVAWTLQRLTGLPWVADFRDIMTTADHPREPGLRRSHAWIERATIRRAARVIHTTPSAQRLYIDRYATLSAATCQVIRNGYDEEDFTDLTDTRGTDRIASEPLRLIHAGLIYDEERDPRPFFRALARLRREGIVKPATLRVDLRGAGSEDYFAGLIRDLGIGDIVRLLPRIAYREALRECSEASALLILQGPSCDGQIPAKAYEYLRLGKPVLALTTASGDTARLLEDCGGATVLDLMDEDVLHKGLPSFLDLLRNRRHPVPDQTRVSRYARRTQAGNLATCLTELHAEHERRNA
jgi:glycosyltransferase involved in cell wall biosynthesis